MTVIKADCGDKDKSKNLSRIVRIEARIATDLRAKAKAGKDKGKSLTTDCADFTDFKGKGEGE